MTASVPGLFTIQQFADAGALAANYRLYTYLQGTTTFKAAYTDIDGAIPHAYVSDGIGGQYIALNSRGELPAPLYIDNATTYDISLKRPDGSTVWTRRADAISAAPAAQAALLASAGGSSLIGFIQSGGAVARTVQDELRDRVSVKQFGVVGDNATDNATAFALVKTYAEAGVPFRIPKGTYLTSQPLEFSTAVNLLADPGARIKLTAGAGVDAVLKIDMTGGVGAWGYGGVLENLILDGGGHAFDGLLLKGVVSSIFRNIRSTNVTRAGLHLAWAQCCTFDNYTCSGNVETFTTTPVNGILGDTASSSANTFINPVVEKVSGAGILGVAIINSQFIGGTSEGNAIGIEFGESIVGPRTASGNIVVGMDLEENSASDIVLRATAYSNHFIGLQGGYQSPAVQIYGAYANEFVGGTTGGFALDGASHDNRMSGVKLLGAGRTVTDAGVKNSWQGIYNVSSGLNITDSGPVGTTAVNNASAGHVGELLTNTASGVGMTSDTPANIVSLSLTAGDWDVDGMMNFNPAGTTPVTLTQGGIGVTSGALPAFPALVGDPSSSPAAYQRSLVFPTTRINVAATTTVYIVANAAFTVSTLTAAASIRARRVR